MVNKKIKLTSDLSLKEVAFDSNQFYIPKKLLVDFSDVRPRPVYKDGKATDAIECYVLAAVDERTATAIEQGLIDLEDVKKITVEVHGSFDDIEKLMDTASIVSVELLNVSVKAKWIDGRNPNYKGYKLEASGLKLAQ